MENWDSCSGEQQQGVWDLSKGEGPTPFPVLPGFPWIPDRASLSLSLVWEIPGQVRTRTPSLGTADSKKIRILHPAGPAG